MSLINYFALCNPVRTRMRMLSENTFVKIDLNFQQFHGFVAYLRNLNPYLRALPLCAKDLWECSVFFMEKKTGQQCLSIFSFQSAGHRPFTRRAWVKTAQLQHQPVYPLIQIPVIEFQIFFRQSLPEELSCC